MDTTALAGLSLAELENLLAGLPRFRSSQIYKWILRGVFDFGEMTDIPASLRDDLKTRYRFFSSVVKESFEDDSNAKKIVLELRDKSVIESVLLNDGKNRLTACLSTQAGCPIGCVFCKTGTLGFIRNLDSNEITEQFLRLKALGENSSRENNARVLDNIVIMGMGEPLLNLDALRKAIAIFTDPDGIGFSRRRITISTCGIQKGLFDIACNGPFTGLALSLVTADAILREKLIPAARDNSLEKIKEALILFQRNGGGRVTLEIPLLGGINTRDADVLSIADFARGMDTVINIIPWNPVPGLLFNATALREPDKKEISDYAEKLARQGLKVTTRARKGRGVMGACGQLG